MSVATHSPPGDGRHQWENAIRLVSGYYLSRPHEALGKRDEVFARARKECLDALQAQIDAVAGLTAEDFFGGQRRGRKKCK